ncbi:hypothetical protein A2U01_0099376, partial [Trifolium medium]|nr:hypothetical protein [Trifolium medium]
MGFSHVELSIDSKTVMKVITTGQMKGTSGYAIVKKISSYLVMDWNVEVLHEYREANKC